MFKLKVKFDTISQIKSFVNFVTTKNCDFDISHDRFVIDAKSIMGIFSLDLSNELTLICHTDDIDLCNSVKAELKTIGIMR